MRIGQVVWYRLLNNKYQNNKYQETEMIKIRTKFLGVIAGAILSQSAFAEVNFAGKTIEWTIPFSETGGSAKWANFFAPLLSEALPGNPTVVVKFMPGAGSTKGANWFQRQNIRTVQSCSDLPDRHNFRTY